MLFTTAAGVVWDRLPTADPGGLPPSLHKLMLITCKMSRFALCAYGTP